MLKILVVLIGIMSSQCYAGYLGSSSPSKLFGASNIKFSVDNEDTSNTCNYYGRSFAFDATTDAGKNMLSILLAATMSGKKIDIWFVDSKAPGTNHTNGCNGSTMAIVTSIGLS